MKVVLKKVRLQFWNGFVADKFGRYSATLMLDKVSDKAQIATINAAIAAVAKEKFAAKADTMLKVFKADKQKYCLQDGDTKLTGEGEPTAPGMMVLSATRKQKDGSPKVINKDKSELNKDSSRPYAGCYVNASVDVWAQEGEFAGIRCSLIGIMFEEDGQSFGGAPAASADDFADFEGDDLSDL